MPPRGAQRTSAPMLALGLSWSPNRWSPSIGTSIKPRRACGHWADSHLRSPKGRAIAAKFGGSFRGLPEREQIRSPYTGEPSHGRDYYVPLDCLPGRDDCS